MCADDVKSSRKRARAKVNKLSLLSLVLGILILGILSCLPETMPDADAAQATDRWTPVDSVDASVAQDRQVVSDLGFVDHAMTDSAEPDGSSADRGDVLDAGFSDLGLPDMAIVDSALADHRLADVSAADSLNPDAALADATPSDMDRPDLSILDADVSDIEAFDGFTADAGVAPRISRNGRYWLIRGLNFLGLSDRNVVVYTPAAYDDDISQRFAVLYMHDGQNLFDPNDAAYGVAWEVDDTVDSMVASGGIPPVIVVAIDNSPERLSDYSPDPDPYYGGGQGDTYADALVQVIKPFIDAHFRTLPERPYTSVMGSSMGGLISLHLAMRYPEVFGRVACVSPSLWWNSGSALQRFSSYTGLLPIRLWLDAGNLEGDYDDPSNLRFDDLSNLRDLALGKGAQLGHDLGYLEAIGGSHNEASWATRLPAILRYLQTDTTYSPSGIDALKAASLHRHIEVLSGLTSTRLSVQSHYPDQALLTWPNDNFTMQSLAFWVASVDVDGVVSAKSLGTSYLLASSQGYDAYAAVTVGSQEQARQTLVVRVPASTPSDGTVYLTGNLAALGSWDAAAIPLTQVAPQTWSVTLSLDHTQGYTFKFTRGDWSSVEKDINGNEIANRLGVASDSLVDLTVLRWADQ